MEPDRQWCRVVSLDAAGAVTGTWRLGGAGRPDLATVDELAHLALEAVRRGERLVVDGVAPELEELLHLAALPVEVRP